jgi:hypothetical protein
MLDCDWSSDVCSSDLKGCEGTVKIRPIAASRVGRQTIYR